MIEALLKKVLILEVTFYIQYLESSAPDESSGNHVPKRPGLTGAGHSHEKAVKIR